MLGNRALVATIRAKGLFLNDPAALALAWRRLAVEENGRRLILLRQDPQLSALESELAAMNGCCDDPQDNREKLRTNLVNGLRELRASMDAAHTYIIINRTRALDAKGGSKRQWASGKAFDRVLEIRNEFRDLCAPYLPPDEDPAIEAKSAHMTCDLLAVLSHVEDALRRETTENVARDFDDLINDTFEVLRTNKEIRDRTARGIRHLLIDEFQDTDSRQLAIARLLVHESDVDPQPELFIVGDAKQSIYYFRGAEVEVFAEAREAAGKTIRLERNFRSVPEVLEFANDFFAQSRALSAVEPEYKRIEPDRKRLNACRVEFLIPLGRDKKTAIKDYRKDEAELIAGRIAQMCHAAPVSVSDPDTGESRPARFGDAAILFRALRDVYLYESALRRRNIPYMVIAGTGFYERQEVADMRNLLAVIVDPSNEMALLGLLRSPMAGLSDESLVSLCDRRRLVQAFRAKEVPAGFPQPERLEHARQLVCNLRANREMPLPAFLRHVLDRTQYEAILAGQFLGPQKVGNVHKMIDLAEAFSRGSAGGLGAFVRYLDEVAAQEIREGEAAIQPEGVDSVTLMTIHKSKGLEFPIVVVPDLARNLAAGRSSDVLLHRDLGVAVKVAGEQGEPKSCSMYTLIQRARDEHETAENARVLYVAMTRARDWLLLAGAPIDKGADTSWMGAIDKVYKILEKNDGDVLRGDGWCAVIRKQPGPERIPEPAVESGSPLTDQDVLRRMGRIEAVAPARKTFSVSEIVNMPDGDQVLAAEGGRERSKALLRGTLIHRILEEWDWKSDPGTLVQRVFNEEGPASPRYAELERNLLAVAERLRSLPIARHIAAQAAGAQREAPFLLRVDDALVSGTVDLLLSDGTIIDYKTGERHDEVHARYTWQVQLYAAAVHQLQGIDPSAAYLLYLDLGELVEVEITRAAVEAALTRTRDAITLLKAKVPVLRESRL